MVHLMHLAHLLDVDVHIHSIMNKNSFHPKWRQSLLRKRYFSTNRKLSLKIMKLLFFIKRFLISEKNFLLRGKRHLIRTGICMMHKYSGAGSASSAPCFGKLYSICRPKVKHSSTGRTDLARGLLSCSNCRCRATWS